MQLLQRCQMGIERLDAAEAREAEWVVETDELRVSLAAKDVMLAEEVARNAGLVFDFEESKVEVESSRTSWRTRRPRTSTLPLSSTISG